MNSQSIWKDIEAIRDQAPLVHNITNFVVMNTTANALLALGASPVMAHAPEEVEDMVSIAGALVINIGTLRGPWVAAMHKAMARAAALKKPIVLDPVGAGATAYRTEAVKELIGTASPQVIRGNASEIMSVAHSSGGTKGVDSSHASDAALEAARELAARLDCTVAVSGAVDLIISGDRGARIHNGHAMMPRVTGLGCTASALLGAFLAVNPSAFEASVHTMAVMGIAGEIAAEKAVGPGSLQMHFLDALYTLSPEELGSRLRLEEFRA